MTIFIANAIDFIAALIQVGSGSIKQKAKILAVQTIQIFLQAVSMLLLGGVTGAANGLLSCYRNYLCYKDKLSIPWKIFLIAASIVSTIFLNDQGFWGIIPTVVCTVYIILMDTKDPIKFKLLVTLTFVPWFFYHFIIKSYVGAIFDIATVTTNAITLGLMIKKKNAASQ